MRAVANSFAYLINGKAIKSKIHNNKQKLINEWVNNNIETLPSHHTAIFTYTYFEKERKRKGKRKNERKKEEKKRKKKERDRKINKEKEVGCQGVL